MIADLEKKFAMRFRKQLNSLVCPAAALLFAAIASFLSS